MLGLAATALVSLAVGFYFGPDWGWASATALLAAMVVYPRKRGDRIMAGARRGA
jgi:hypothetical protein